MAFAAVTAAGIGAAGAIGSSMLSGGGSSGSTTSTSTSSINPHMNGLLFGDDNGNGGYIEDVRHLQYQPQDPGLQRYGNDANAYLGSGAALGNISSALNTANGMLGWSQQTPTMNNASMQAAGMNAAGMNAAQINAPGQNGVDLAPSYQNMISGASGDNPYLRQQIQSGIDQGNAGYNTSIGNLTDTLTRQILPGINSGAVAAGGYGGSRQGIAQSNAINDYAKQLAQGATQMGIANTGAAATAMANSYNQGQDRALNAMNNLSNQQYGVASQNAQLQQQANATNAGFQQQANANNAGFQQQAGQTNAGFQQQANQSNLQSNLSTNALNSSNALGAMSQIGNLTGQVYNTGSTQNAYPFWQMQQVTNQLSPFTGLGGQTSQTTPYYTNPVGNAMGGAMAGMGLYNAYNQANQPALGSGVFGGSNSGLNFSGGGSGANLAGNYSLGFGS